MVVGQLIFGKTSTGEVTQFPKEPSGLTFVYASSSSSITVIFPESHLIGIYAASLVRSGPWTKTLGTSV